MLTVLQNIDHHYESYFFRIRWDCIIVIVRGFGVYECIMILRNYWMIIFFVTPFHTVYSIFNPSNSEIWNLTTRITPTSKCDCGLNSISCELVVNTIKKCTCKKGYEQAGMPGYETCKKCDCGMYATSCKYMGDLKKCSCKSGYIVEEGGFFEGDKGCKVCDCGANARSCYIISSGKKKCDCKSGYVSIYHQRTGNTCETCDCGDHFESCWLGYNDLIKCSCQPGYQTKVRSAWNNNEKCVPIVLEKPEDVKAWKIATGVTIVIYGAIITVLLIKIYHDRMKRH